MQSLWQKYKKTQFASAKALAIANHWGKFRKLAFIWKKPRIFHFDLSHLTSPLISVVEYAWTHPTKFISLRFILPFG